MQLHLQKSTAWGKDVREHNRMTLRGEVIRGRTIVFAAESLSPRILPGADRTSLSVG